MTTRVPRSRQRRGDERREKILRSTLAIVARDGLAKVTHRSVAAEAVVPAGSIVYYFPTKAKLLREALGLFVDEEVARLEAFADDLASEGTSSPEEAARRCAAIVESSGELPIGQFELYLEAARDPALQDVTARCFAAYDRVTQAGLQSLGVDVTSREAALVVALGDGLVMRRAAAPEAETPSLEEAYLVLFGALGGAAEAELAVTGGASRTGPRPTTARR